MAKGLTFNSSAFVISNRNISGPSSDGSGTGGSGAPVTAFESRIGAITAEYDDYQGALVQEDRATTNYTAASGDHVEGHLEGIDNALGILYSFFCIGTNAELETFQADNLMTNANLLVYRIENGYDNATWEAAMAACTISRATLLAYHQATPSNYIVNNWGELEAWQAAASISNTALEAKMVELGMDNATFKAAIAAGTLTKYELLP